MLTFLTGSEIEEKQNGAVGLEALPQKSESFLDPVSTGHDFVGVGMIITDHPLHRSGRALLTHPALALGADAKPQLRIRVMQRRPW